MLLRFAKSGSCGEEDTSGPEKLVQTPTDSNTPVHYQVDVPTAERIRFSSYSNNAGTILGEGHVTGEALMKVDLNPCIVSDYDGYEALGAHEANHFYSMSIANWQDAESAALKSTLCSDSSVHTSNSKVVPLLHLYMHP